MSREKESMDFYKKKAQELLDEVPYIRKPGITLSNWNIRAQTLLIFVATKQLGKINTDEQKQ